MNHRPGHDDPTASIGRRNMHLGIAHGAFAELGKALADPNVVLALLVRQLGGSHTLVGLLSSIRHGSLFLPQLVVASRIETKPRKAPYYIRAELTRSAGYMLIAFAIVCISKPSVLLPVFLVLFSASYLAHGASSVPNFDVIGKAVPAERRGSFFARRNLWGGLGGLIAGLAVRQALSTGDARAPALGCYALLIAFAALCFTLAVAIFSRIAEPIIDGNDRQPISWLKQLRRAPDVLAKNQPFRALAVTLVLTSVAQRLADPFFMIFATEVLHVPVAVAGVYLSVRILSEIMSNLFWEQLSRRYPNRVVLQCSTASAIVAPALALILGTLADSRSLPSPLWTSLIAGAFGLVYLLIGIRDSGKYVGKRSVLLDIVPTGQRPTHWGLLNTLLGFVSVLPLLAGRIVDYAGFQPVFGAAVVMATVGWLASRRLETRCALVEA